MSFIRTIPKPAVLALLVPVSFYLAHIEANSILIFIITSLAILGLIGFIAKATDQMCIYSGPVVGGLLQATFGNFTEFIVCIFAVWEGMHVLVLASFTGSIIGNLLLVLGLSMFFGGLKHKTQKFSRTGANAAILMLAVALVALIIPTFVHYGYNLDPDMSEAIADVMVNKISICTAVVMLIVYLLSLVFSLKTHKFAMMPKSETSEKPVWKKPVALVVLFATAIIIGFESDIFVDAIKNMIQVQKIMFSELFMGIIFVAAIGNACDGAVAIIMARKNRMDISFQVATGASIQVALFIVPVIVLFSFIIGKPLTLVFNMFEIIAIWSGLLIAGYSLLDGESNWFEGVMFIAVYLLVGIVFFFHP
ncbi:MAG: calcium/proton exchanger [Candidatus Ancaeobacter aquaticus]|nr:calcium/proton exchanger [Candidatus Ancaeobacter aquaticus]